MFAAAMAGENSPDIMFGKNGQRGENMGADVCGGVCMGALGSRDTGGQESKVIRGVNGSAGRVLQCVTTTKKA